jgi:hypothetical protein
MPKQYATRASGDAVRYAFVIRGAIEQPLNGPLEGMTIEAAEGESVLVGSITDQAQLQGVLNWLSDLGVETVSVNPVPEGRSEH